MPRPSCVYEDVSRFLVVGPTVIEAQVLMTSLAPLNHVNVMSDVSQLPDVACTTGFVEANLNDHDCTESSRTAPPAHLID